MKVKCHTMEDTTIKLTSIMTAEDRVKALLPGGVATYTEKVEDVDVVYNLCIACKKDVGINMPRCEYCEKTSKDKIREAHEAKVAEGEKKHRANLVRVTLNRQKRMLEEAAAKDKEITQRIQNLDNAQKKLKADTENIQKQ